MPLHTDLRPTSFDQVLGNAETVESLRNLLSDKKRPHCYLFKGPSGSGKSTVARIMAHELGASEMDVHEYNIADARGIDTAREIISKIHSMPLGLATVIILDEIHKATGGFQEALLKPTEDVPPHVYFFMCTTEPSKITPTLRRRFTAYQFKYVKEMTLMKYLMRVVKTHGYVIDTDALETVVERSEGSVAKALVLLDKIKSVEASKQKSLLDDVDDDTKQVIDLCRTLLNGNKWKSLVVILDEINKEPESIRHIVLAYMTKVLKSGGYNAPKAAIVLDIFGEPFYNEAALVLACYQVIHN